MKYSQDKQGSRAAILAGAHCAEETVPTVFFDLSDYAGGELPGSQSTSMGLSAPSVEEHYGVWLQREEQAHQRTQEKLRMAQEQMRCMQDETKQRELEFEEEKRELIDMIDEKEEVLAWEQSQLEIQIQQERDMTKAENARLKERVKKLSMIQSNLLKQVSMLMTEREELKRLERRKCPRGKTLASSTSSCTSLGAQGINLERMAELNAFVKNGAPKNLNGDVHEPEEILLQDSPEPSVSESISRPSSQDLLRQIRQHTTCYAATRAAVSPRRVSSPRLRRKEDARRDVPSYADVMALPLQDDLMASFAQHLAAYAQPQSDVGGCKNWSAAWTKNVRSVYISIGFYWCITCLFVFLFFVIVWSHFMIASLTLGFLLFFRITCTHHTPENRREMELQFLVRNRWQVEPYTKNTRITWVVCWTEEVSPWNGCSQVYADLQVMNNDTSSKRRTFSTWNHLLYIYISSPNEHQLGNKQHKS